MSRISDFAVAFVHSPGSRAKVEHRYAGLQPLHMFIMRALYRKSTRHSMGRCIDPHVSISLQMRVGWTREALLPSQVKSDAGSTSPTLSRRVCYAHQRRTPRIRPLPPAYTCPHLSLSCALPFGEFHGLRTGWQSDGIVRRLYLDCVVAVTGKGKHELRRDIP